MVKTQTAFLNVDLDLTSQTQLDSIIEALGSQVLALHVGRRRGKHWARLCLAGQPSTPSQAILKISRLLCRLSGRNRTLAIRAATEFDIGIQGGQEPSCSEWVLEPEAIEAVARLGARIRVTVYSAQLRTARIQAGPGETPAKRRLRPSAAVPSQDNLKVGRGRRG